MNRIGMRIGIVAILFPILSTFLVWSIAADFSCDINTATISNRSGNAVLATLDVRKVVFWRGKIEADHTMQVVYRIREDGFIILTAEFFDKKVQGVGNIVDTGAATPEEFVIGPDRIVYMTPRSRPFIDFEPLIRFGTCLVHPVFDLTGTSDIRRLSPSQDKH